MYVFSINNIASKISEKRQQHTMKQPFLSKEKVSFGNKLLMSDIIEHQITQESARMNRLAITFLDVLESVANKLEPFGVSFNRTYCERNPVKSVGSYMRKITRSGKLNIPDWIRATLFVNSPKNLSILNEQILPEIGKRDFVIAKTEANLGQLITKGYAPTTEEVSGKKIVEIPDLDIRLSGVEDQMSKINPEFKYCLGEPQKSGYQDIQMRLIRSFDQKTTPVKHELIILPGKEYAFAKHLESENIYNPIIKSFEELNVYKKAKENPENFQTIRCYIRLIRRMITNEISQKLFKNAEKLDCTTEKDIENIIIGEEEVKKIFEYVSALEKEVNIYYRNAKQSKRIAESTRKKLNKEWRFDKEQIASIKENISEAINFFNEKNYLERRVDFWPELFGENFIA